MEATASGPTRTGSKTIADLLPRAAQLFGGRTAVRYRNGDEWRDASFAQMGAIAQEIGLGLIDLGIAPGDRVCILAKTRPEWSYADFAITMAGAVVVPIYQTNSPEECDWVIGNSEAVAIFC